MRKLARPMHVVRAFTILVLMLLGHAPEHGWSVRAAHAQNNAAADIEGANKKVEQLYLKGQRQAALMLAAETLKRAQSLLGEKHPDTLVSLNNFAIHTLRYKRWAAPEKPCRIMSAR